MAKTDWICFSKKKRAHQDGFFGNSSFFCKSSKTGSKKFHFFPLRAQHFSSSSHLTFLRILYSAFHACLQSCLNSSKIITKPAIALNEP